jgi:hypothetical protein
MTEPSNASRGEDDGATNSSHDAATTSVRNLVASARSCRRRHYENLYRAPRFGRGPKAFCPEAWDQRTPSLDPVTNPEQTAIWRNTSPRRAAHTATARRGLSANERSGEPRRGTRARALRGRSGDFSLDSRRIDRFPRRPGAALSHELNLAARRFEVPVRTQAAVAARHVRKASSRKTRSVRRDVRWRWTLKVLWTAA